MTQPTSCPRCGADIPTNAPEDLCPKCLLQIGLENAMDRGSNERETPTTSATRFTPPTPAELAKHFRQLEILELIGKGGMGAVYKARQLKLDRFVAVKILPPEFVAEPAFAERFTREARALAGLSHPNIVTVFDFGQADELYYLTMEYVEGTNLRQLIETRRLQPHEALAIVPQLCEALQFAHNEAVVHRDIKPENILVDRQGRVKIADFGLAKLLNKAHNAPSLTATHHVMGTPQYMAPEQMRGASAVDHRADIFSLGVVFYEMLTGELPIGKFAPPSRKVCIDVRLDEIVLRSLENEPSRRYQHVSEFQSDLETISRSVAKDDSTTTNTITSNCKPSNSQSVAIVPSPQMSVSPTAFNLLNRAWHEWWGERSQWLAMAIQALLVAGHMVCLMGFFGATIVNKWQGAGEPRKYKFTVGALDPWYQFETYPTPDTPFQFHFHLLTRSILFPIVGFSLYYVVWRIEKARKPTAGWWSSPMPMVILWASIAVVLTSFGMHEGFKTLREPNRPETPSTTSTLVTTPQLELTSTGEAMISRG